MLKYYRNHSGAIFSGMEKLFKKTLVEIVESELEKRGYSLALSGKNIVYHMHQNGVINIIQFTQDERQPCITIAISAAFPTESKENSNINYEVFNARANGDLSKITVDDCLCKHYLKGNFGRKFHYGNVYLTVGMGIIGVSDNAQKPLGIRIKKHKPTTDKEVCELIKKRLIEDLNRAYNR